MKKTRAIVLIVFILACSLLLNVFFGRFLTAKISTLSFLNRFHLLSPQTPIVINQRQEIRVSDTGDVLAALDSVKSKLSSVISVSNNTLTSLGGAVNLTSDGLFVTAKSVVDGAKPENLIIKLENGSTGKVTAIMPDPATNLVLLKADISGVPVVDFGSSAGLVPGQKLIFVINTPSDHSPIFQNGFVSQSQASNIAAPRDAGFPKRSFNVQISNSLLPGQAVVDTNSDIAGIWDGGNIISSDVIQDLTDRYLNSNHVITRPGFGFSYKLISALESRFLNTSAGAKVLAVAPVSPAQKAGLAAGDTISQINGQAVNEQSQLEELLQKYKPGDIVSLTVLRAGQSLTLNLIPGELK